MSLIHDCVGAFAAGVALTCAVCGGFAAAGQFRAAGAGTAELQAGRTQVARVDVAQVQVAQVQVAQVQAGQIQVGIDNFTFTPAAVTVRAGTRVEWQNKDDIPHTVVETAGGFHSEALDTEDKFSFGFDRPGTYEYFCSLHPHMTGKIVVTP